MSEGICANNEKCKLNKPVPLFNGLCKWCSKSHKKGKDASKPPKAESIKQAAINRAYSLDVAVFKAENPKCMAKLQGCTGYTVDCHHPYSGAERSGHVLDKSTWIPVCRPCHDRIHNVMSAAELKELNLKKS